MSNAGRIIKRAFDALYVLAILVVWALGLWAFLEFIVFPERESLVFEFTPEQTLALLQPRWLGLALVIPVFWLLRKWSLSDLPWLQQLLNVTLRSLLILALVLAVARVVVTRYDSKVAVVFLVDVSESGPDSLLEAARDSIQEVYEQRGRNTIRVVTFARDAREVPIPPGAAEVPTLRRHSEEGAGLESNLAVALSFSYGLFPQDHLKRVVVISDGRFNRGDLLSAAHDASQYLIRIYSEEVEIEAAAEVLVRSVDFPRRITANEPFHITLDVFSTYDGEIRLDLTQNDFRDIRGRPFEVRAGQTVQLDLVAEVYEPGMRTFEIDIHADPDRFDDNNHITHTVDVAGRPQVLYVEGESRSSGYLQRALDDERNERVNFDLDVRTARGFPEEVEQMRNFDVIILSDVEAGQISREAMTSLRTYVREYGGSFLMVGGEDSFGPGGYRGTLMEDILPVTFEARRSMSMPSVALMLVIDRSGSMEGLKLEMAKDAARASVELLGPQDRVGVIAFDSSPQQVVRLQSASNRIRIDNDIARISPGGGTDIYLALEEAYLQLTSVRASTKHVILLSDGEAPREGISELVRQMRRDRISVSTVGVGRDVDRYLMEMIADLALGRYYYTNSAQSIPQIFVRETSRISRTNIVEEPFRPTLATRSSATSGIDFSAVPYLLGYVSTEAKNRATVALETELGEPLYAYWRYGHGQTAVFTSDCKNRWMVEWLRDPLYPQFWAQVVRHLMPDRPQAEEEMDIEVAIVDGRGHVMVDAIADDGSFINGLQSLVQIAGPEGHQQEITLDQTAAGRYEAFFELPHYGSYRIEAQHQFQGEMLATSLASLANPYPDEYLVGPIDHGLTRQAVTLSGGRVDPSSSALLDPEGERLGFEQDIWPYFIFSALGLLILDILMRRIRLYGRTVLDWGSVKQR